MIDTERRWLMRRRGCVSAPDRDPSRNRTIKLISNPKYEYWRGPDRRRLGPYQISDPTNKVRGIAQTIEGSRFGSDAISMILAASQVAPISLA
jgi:hypothetical protein